MRKIKLHWQILIAIVLSVIYGIFFKDYIWYISWMGTIFMNALKMVIVPLVLCSITAGVTSIGSSDNFGRLGLKTFTYYITTTLLAIVTGLFLVNLVKPGINLHCVLKEAATAKPEAVSQLTDTFMKIVPSNIFRAFLESEMLSIIFFAMLFGYFITRVGEKHRNLLINFFQAGSDVMMKITFFVIRFTPLGVFGLVSVVVAKNNDLLRLLQTTGLYMLVVIMGLLIHFFISLPLIVKFIAKAEPYKLMKLATTPLLTAFSTCSSGATLPLSMDAVENNAGVSKKISSFTLPLGATVNMDGTALYECVAAMFIAQAYGIDLTIGEQVLVVFTALIASICAAAVPMAGLFMMTIILTAVHLPMEGIALIIAVDRLLDMPRTCTNTWSDICGAVTVARAEGEKLKV